MKTTSPLFHGTICQDYSALLESDSVINAAAKKPAKKKPTQKKPAKLDTESGKNCSSPNVCTVTGCKSKKYGAAPSITGSESGSAERSRVASQRLCQ